MTNSTIPTSSYFGIIAIVVERKRQLHIYNLCGLLYCL